MWANPNIIFNTNKILKGGLALYQKAPFFARYFFSKREEGLSYGQVFRKGVKAVIIDRFKVYKKVAKEMFPNALIIPDNSHLVARVNSALDKVRKNLQKEKREIGYGKFKVEPILSRAYGFRNEENFSAASHGREATERVLAAYGGRKLPLTFLSFIV